MSHLNYLQDHRINKGDTRTAVGAVLQQSEVVADIAADSTVEFKMVNAKTGVVKQDWTAATIIDRAAAKVQYAFTSANVDTPGEYWMYFRIVTSGSKYDTFPPGEQKFRLIIGDTT